MKKALLIGVLLIALLWIVGTTRDGSFYDEEESPPDGRFPDSERNEGLRMSNLDDERKKRFKMLASGVETKVAMLPTLSATLESRHAPQFMTFEQAGNLGMGETVESNEMTEDLPLTYPKGDNVPGDVEPGRLASGTIIISNETGLHVASRMIAAGVIASMATPAIDDTASIKAISDLADIHKNAEFTFLFAEGEGQGIIDRMAQRLEDIGDISTKGWHPRNRWAFGPGGNNFLTPARTKATIANMLELRTPMVNVAGKTWMSAYNFVYELATLYTIDSLYRLALGEQPTLIDRVLKGAVSAGVSAIGGLSTGPWGAVAGAVTSAIGSISSELTKEMGRSDREAEIEGKVAGAFASISSSQKRPWKSFLKEEGYSFTSVTLPDRVKKYPANLWSQSSAHGFPPVEQGTYPGVGLYAYLGPSTQVFKGSLDTADILVAADWEAPLDRKQSGASSSSNVYSVD